MPMMTDAQTPQVSPPAPQGALQPPLDEYRRQFEAGRDDARQLIAGLDREQLNWSPAPGKWSIAQCLVHLNSVDRAYVRRLERGIEEARERGRTGVGKIRYGLLERWLIRSMEPPPRRRFPAPRPVVPAADHDPEAVEKFLATQDRLIELLQLANGVDVVRTKIVSPLSKLLKLRLGAAFAFLAAHDRRHLWQARQVRQHADFPPAGAATRPEES